MGNALSQNSAVTLGVLLEDDSPPQLDSLSSSATQSF